MKMTLVGLIILIAAVFTCFFHIDNAFASETIYIRPDGGVEPSYAPVQRNGDVFTLTNDINSDIDGIIIERNDTVLDGAGHRLQGTNTEFSRGIYMMGISNVTVKNMTIAYFESGILLDAFSINNSVTDNKLASNDYGVSCWAFSDNNTIVGNNMTGNSLAAVWIVGSSNETILGNYFSNNNQYAIILESSANNTIYHNNFISDADQVSIYDSTARWDNSYPSGGNYWSDYSGVDEYSGQNQNEPGSDGIGDIPYECGEGNTDNYPLITPWINLVVSNVAPSKTAIPQGQSVNINVSIMNQGWEHQAFNVTIFLNTTVLSSTTNLMLQGRNSTVLTATWETSTYEKASYAILAEVTKIQGEPDTRDNSNFCMVTLTIHGDVNGDAVVDIFDAITLANAYGSNPNSSNWNPNADINNDNTVDIYDAIILASNYGKTS